MTDTIDIEPGGPDIMAGEYVLGVLEGEDRAAAERRFETDPHFVAEVAAWERRLAPLIESLGDEQPSPAVWRRIVADLALAEPGARRSPVRRVWNSLPVWRGLTAASAAVAAAAVVVVLNPAETAPVTPPAAPQPGPMAVALLKPEAGPAVFVVTLDPENHRMIITPVTPVGTPRHSPELWLLPKDGAAPVSLGLLDTGRALVLPTGKMGTADELSAALAVSLEPLGGSPTGLPTGPVVAQGQLSAL